MPSTDPHEVERVEDWPVVELSRRAAGYPLYLKANSLPADEFETYYPASAPNVLSPDEARVLSRYVTPPECISLEESTKAKEIAQRLSDYAKDPKGVTDGSD